MDIAIIGIDDDFEDTGFMKEALNSAGENATFYTEPEEILKAMEGKPSVIIADYHLTKARTGVEVIREAIKLGHLFAPVFTSGNISIAQLRDIISLNWGAYFVEKNRDTWFVDLVREVNKARKELDRKINLSHNAFVRDEEFRESARKILERIDKHTGQ